MSQSLYDADFLAWSEHQGDLLRRLSAGERLNEAVDWPNVIEEIEDLGRSELHGCESLLRQALVHLLKLHAWPASRSAPHWRSETVAFLADARKRFAPSMRSRIDIAELYEVALRQVAQSEDESGPPNAREAGCPFGLDDLLAKDADIRALAGRLG